MSKRSRPHTYPFEGSGRGGHVESWACDDAKKRCSPSGMNQPHVVLPWPLETRLSPDPSIRITYCWSQVRPSRVDWNVSHCPSRLKYASAFSPPKVTCRILVRWLSPGCDATG